MLVRRTAFAGAAVAVALVVPGSSGAGAVSWEQHSEGYVGRAAVGAAAGAPLRFPSSPRGMKAPVNQPREVEEPAPYAGQVSCNPVPMRGVRKFRRLAVETYGRGNAATGIERGCSRSSASEHQEGRAWDWMLNVHNDRDRQVARNFLGWLTQTRANGTAGTPARRLGIMYVIYNRRMWRSYDPGWTAYEGWSPHTDHIHISFGWAGARGRTSFWTGKVAGPDYGPCRVFRGQFAPIPVRANARECAAASRPVKRSTRAGAVLGRTDSRPVRFAQRRLGLPRTGDFDSTTWNAVKRYQRRHDLPVTGVLDQPTWASLAPRSVRWSATADYENRPVRAARYAARRWSDVRLRRGSHGKPVAFLQVALQMPRSYRNGLLGRRTAAAVRALKVSEGLRDTPVVTPAVWEALAAR